MGITRETAERIVKGITDKIETNTADMNDWAEFWGFTVDEYEEPEKLDWLLCWKVTWLASSLNAGAA